MVLHSLLRPRLAVLLLAAALLPCSLRSAQAQMVTGTHMPGYEDVFDVRLNQVHYAYLAHLIASSVPGNILRPGDQPKFTIQLVNQTDQPIDVAAKAHVIAYGTKGAPGDVWTPHVYRVGEVAALPVHISMPARGYCDVTVAPHVPARNGGYALVIDLGPGMGRQFVTSFVRTFAAPDRRIQYPHFCLDEMPLDVLKRLGVHAIRYGIGYKPTTDSDFADWYRDQSARLRKLQAANVAVLFMVGAGEFYHPDQPLKQPRPWLDSTDTMLDTKTDIAWMPSYDDDFQRFCHRFTADFGWPRGPIDAFSLWNEPWEGISISGWGADMLRYRAMYHHMAQGVRDACQANNVQVLVGGCDSTSNAQDKLFPDGPAEFLPIFDFVSIHYQGLDPHSTVKQWMNRKSPNGRVKIWDTESWVANTDDRVAAIVAGDRAAGYDRAMGVFGGNIAEEQDYDRRLPDGKTDRVTTVTTWSTAAAVGAATHFIGERAFDRILFRSGLPWIMLFDGLPRADGRPDPDDGTAVVVGDLSEEFGQGQLPLRTARGYAELAHKAALRNELAGLPSAASAAKRQELLTQIDTPETLSGATLTLPASPDYSLYDFYGNPVPAQGGHIVAPLDGCGFFLRASGAPGSFARLITALKTARIEGIEPLAIVAHDMTAPISQHPMLRLSLTNVLNRPVKGTLRLRLGDLKVTYPSIVEIGPNQTRDVNVRVLAGSPTVSNSYPLTVSLQSGASERVEYAETMHVNWIARRTITVDGDLSDWKGILPQTIQSTGQADRSLTEAAWFPFKNFSPAMKSGFATGYLAYDANYFYFASRAADSTPDPGMVRFATRDDDAYFYPKVSYQLNPAAVIQKRDVIWAAATSEKRALRRPDAPVGDRLLAGWESTVKTFVIDLNLTDGRPHQVALYLLDTDDDPVGRREQKITITDADTGRTLDSRDYRGFRLGQYAIYVLSGHVHLSLTTNNWLSAEVSGLFFDNAGAVPATASTGGATASFARIDTDTQGNWQGAYGKEGYEVIGTPARLPAYAEIALPEHVDRTEHVWPDGVRRYSYRKDPDLPSSNGDHDNILIAFNVLPQSIKPWELATRGTMPGFINYKDTDYEYALNPVAPQYGGGTEIWRLEFPGMPHKHFYPRQPKSSEEGPVTAGKLVTRRDGNTRIVECAIPWSEIPWVKRRLDAGQTVKFSFRVNDNVGGACMELARGRSVAKRNGAFHPDWQEHWANELEFGFER